MQFVHLLRGERLWCCQYHQQSHVNDRMKSLTLDNVVFLIVNSGLCLMNVIRHGDKIEALQTTSKRRRNDHDEDIIQKVRKEGALGVQN